MAFPLSRSAQDTALSLCSSLEVFPEDPHPVHARWTVILTQWPELRHRSFLDNVDDLVQKATESGTLVQKTALFDYMRLKARYLHILYHSQLIPTHVKHWFDDEVMNYQYRLWHQMVHYELPVRKGTRLHRKKTAAPPFRWYH